MERPESTKETEKPEVDPPTKEVERPQLVPPKKTEVLTLLQLTKQNYDLMEMEQQQMGTNEQTMERKSQEFATRRQLTKQMETVKLQRWVMKSYLQSEIKPLEVTWRLGGKLKQRNQEMKEGLEKPALEVKQKLENLEQPLNIKDKKQRQAEFAQKLKQWLDSAQSMKVTHSMDQKQRLEEKLAKLLWSIDEEKGLASTSKFPSKFNVIDGETMPTNPQQIKILQNLAIILSLYEHGNYPHTTTGLNSIPGKIQSRKGGTPSKSNSVQSTSTCDKEMYKINNNQISVCPADKSSYLYQESESPLSDASSPRCDHFVNIDDLDVMSVGIDSDITSVDRDIRVVRHKKMTDPSPAYRQQFYIGCTWRYEQSDSSAIESCLTVSSQNSIEADESGNDSNTRLPTEHTQKQKRSKTSRQLKGKRDQIDYSSSEDSHWSIILQRDLKD